MCRNKPPNFSRQQKPAKLIIFADRGGLSDDLARGSGTAGCTSRDAPAGQVIDLKARRGSNLRNATAHPVRRTRLPSWDHFGLPVLADAQGYLNAPRSR